MPDDVVLLTEPRTDRGSGPAGRLRRAGRLPAVVYGLGQASAEVTVPTHELDMILAHGVNSLITLRVDGDDQLALARQVQRGPVRGELLHVDFVRVRRDVAISADVAVHLVGEAEGVKDGGLLEQQVFTITVEAKPQDIPAHVEFDVSALAIGDQLRVSDLTLPRGVTTSLDPETLVVAVAAPRIAVEDEEAEGAEGEGAEGGESEAPAGDANQSGESSEAQS